MHIKKICPKWNSPNSQIDIFQHFNKNKMLGEYFEEHFIYDMPYKSDAFSNRKVSTLYDMGIHCVPSPKCMNHLGYFNPSNIYAKCVSFQVIYSGNLKMKLFLNKYSVYVSWHVKIHILWQCVFQKQRSWLLLHDYAYYRNWNTHLESLVLRVKHKPLKSEKHQAQLNLLSFLYCVSAYCIKIAAGRQKYARFLFIIETLISPFVLELRIFQFHYVLVFCCSG